jgi:hypothetical protein
MIGLRTTGVPLEILFCGTFLEGPGHPGSGEGIGQMRAAMGAADGYEIRSGAGDGARRVILRELYIILS